MFIPLVTVSMKAAPHKDHDPSRIGSLMKTEKTEWRKDTTNKIYQISKQKYNHNAKII